MTYLLDTCIVSKLRKLKIHPDKKLSKWISLHKENSYFLSVLTVGEIQAGISKLAHKYPDELRHRMILEDWLLGELIPRFQDRILGVSEHVAFAWGKLIGEGKQKGVNIPLIDALIAATAIVYGLVLVTDNVKDFENLGVEIINPWNL